MARRRSGGSKVKTFTSKGGTVSGVAGTGLLARLGAIIPGTNQVYRHPRVKADPLAGGSVRVTNSRASGPAANERTASLGMGGVGQRGRNRDIP